MWGGQVRCGSCSLGTPHRSIELAEHPATWLNPGETQMGAAAVYQGCVFATYARVATAFFERTQFKGYISEFGDEGWKGSKAGRQENDLRGAC